MSGDMDTGLGNSLDAVAFIVTCLRILHITRYDILCDGDDCLIFVHPDDEQLLLSNIKDIYLKFGHELKVEGVARDITQLEWCQSKPIRVLDSDGVEQYMFVQDPRKVFATMGSHIHCRTPEEATSYFNGIVHAYQTIYSAIPFYRQLKVKPVETSRSQRLPAGLVQELSKMHKIKTTESINTLPDFCAAFDIPIEAVDGHIQCDLGEVWARMRGE